MPLPAIQSGAAEGLGLPSLAESWHASAPRQLDTQALPQPPSSSPQPPSPLPSPPPWSPLLPRSPSPSPPPRHPYLPRPSVQHDDGCAGKGPGCPGRPSFASDGGGSFNDNDAARSKGAYRDGPHGADHDPAGDLPHREIGTGPHHGHARFGLPMPFVVLAVVGAVGLGGAVYSFWMDQARGQGAARSTAIRTKRRLRRPRPAAGLAAADSARACGRPSLEVELPSGPTIDVHEVRPKRSEPRVRWSEDTDLSRTRGPGGKAHRPSPRRARRVAEWGGDVDEAV